MCDKSLASETCNSNASCGISVRFQTLSPSHRQIAHALLTRPPLIGSRSSVTVRLECVKHAASVHPEPGSNSLKNGIITSNFHPNLKSFSELFFLSFFYLVLCVQSYWQESFSFFSSVVQFSRTVLRLSFRALMKYITNIPLCQHLFSKKFIFFHVFKEMSKTAAKAAVLLVILNNYSTEICSPGSTTSKMISA